MSSDHMAELGAQAIAAVRNCLKAFPMPGGQTSGDPEAARELTTFTAEANQAQVYQLVAIAAAVVRLASLETGRSETEIMDELAKNYER